MNFINTFFIAIALSFDAMAVGAANGARHYQMPFFKTLQISFAFGFFQFFMPIVGWFLGDQFRPFISAYDHWVAFIFLFILGAKMLFESFKNVKEEKIDIHSLKILFLLSIATSIDALVVGMTFAFLKINIALAVSLIGIITFLLTLLAIYLGKKFGERWGKHAEIAGGLILILIGIKILLTHLLS